MSRIYSVATPCRLCMINLLWEWNLIFYFKGWILEKGVCRQFSGFFPSFVGLILFLNYVSSSRQRRCSFWPRYHCMKTSHNHVTPKRPNFTFYLSWCERLNGSLLVNSTPTRVLLFGFQIFVPFFYQKKLLISKILFKTIVLRLWPKVPPHNVSA